MQMLGFKKKTKEKTVFDEELLEKEDAYKRDHGLIADIVIIYPIETPDKLNEELAAAKNPSGNPCGRCLDSLRGTETKASVQKDIDDFNERQRTRADAIMKLRAAGLVAIKSQNALNTHMYVKLSAPLKRMEKEAQRQEIEMLCTPEAAARENETPTNLAMDILNKGGCCYVINKVSGLIFGADSKRVYRDFDRDDRADFDRTGQKEGRLFSALERTRLLYAIIEGSVDMEGGGGAELDLDLLVSKKVFSTYITLHSSGQDWLSKEWGAMAAIACCTNAKLRMMANDYLCIFLWFFFLIFYVMYLSDPSDDAQNRVNLACGFLFCSAMTVAAFLGMIVQPLDDVRDYFGEKIAFYFGWIEHNSRYMFFLSILAFLVVLIETSGRGGGLASYVSLFYCLIVAVWTTLFQESWKRKQATLAHTWDVTDFEEEEDPRPEYLANFQRGRWRHRDDNNLIKGLLDLCLMKGQMVEKRGFFTSDRRFIESANEHADVHKIFPDYYRINVLIRTVITLGFFLVVMLIGAFSILVFKMFVSVAGVPFINASIDGLLPVVASTVWITIMNGQYQKVAKMFNDLENYRTETDYNDALIVKTIIFQFVNSYITLFYVAFIKSGGVPVGIFFGEAGIDHATGDPWRDMCGKRYTTSTAPAPEHDTFPFWSSQTNPLCSNSTGSWENCDFVFMQEDCFNDLRVLMISYTVLKPFYELPLQILGQIIAKIKGQAAFLKNVAKATSKGKLPGSISARSSSIKEVQIELKDGSKSSDDPGSDDEKRAAFHEKIGLQVAQSPYGGTFTEYNPKVIQFGYIAMFSSAFPLAAVCAAVANFIELRIDSLKLVTLSRRPRYEGAEDIGSWQGVLGTISWIALPVNVFILVFTSWQFRDLVVIPLVLGGTTQAECFNSFDMSIPSAFGGMPISVAGEATISHHALAEGRNTSFLAPCKENIEDCYAMIGKEWWLPAATYAPANVTVSLNYMRQGLCKPESLLYNEFHCQTCQHWTNKISATQWMIALVIEHLLILLKMLIGFLIPDTPQWVTDAVARKEFSKAAKAAEKERVRRSSVGASPLDRTMEEKEAVIKGLVDEINTSDDTVDVRPGESTTAPGMEGLQKQNTQTFSAQV